MGTLRAAGSWRRASAVALVLLLVAAHLWVADRWGQLAQLALSPAAQAPPRIEVAFVTELTPTAAPLPAPARRAGPAPTAVVAAALPGVAASAPDARLPQEAVDRTAESPVPLATEVPAPAVAAAAELPPELPSAPRPAPPPLAAEAASATASAMAAPFEWPPSTRMSYLLVGDYRGPVQGRASVEWLKSGERYQVHLDVRVGSDALPLMSRRMSSDGRITAEGLAPLRYDEETRVLLREVRRQTIVFEPERVLTPRGGAQPTMAGIQDTASQFVQLTWLFTTNPERLQAGQTVEVPLALTRRVDRWVYDVVGQESLDTPMGRIPSWYLRPRPQSKTASDLAVEIWFAPTLQYLPVRIRIRQDDASFIDLMLERPPQQEAPRRSG